jgi:hypothetical protein
MQLNAWQTWAFLIVWALIMFYIFRKKWVVWHTNFDVEQSILDQAQRLRLAQQFQVRRQNTLVWGIIPAVLALLFLGAIQKNGPAVEWVGAFAAFWRVFALAFLVIEVIFISSYYRCPFCHNLPWKYRYGRKTVSLDPQYCYTCNICLDPDAL